MAIAFIALGSNIHPRQTFIERAIERLSSHEEIKNVRASAIYETVPVGYTNQDDFLNGVVKVETTLSPVDLLAYCQTIESTLGRERRVRWGPRTIDLDILLYNQANMQTEKLTVPHPRMHERAFVLVPLNDIGSTVYLPNYDKTVQELLLSLPEDEVKGVRPWKRRNGQNEKEIGK
ncbi:2-amino-4-hydroxy-6-hydroxymethyldihydropteridine diphosphokinase [Pontibacillus litoralis]|uniref:2-amino-4-hydroxy-6-hydroxymethyldihydropteridine diphosphokinase n=1 Tax=Pontibacillus litoralis JSM 072002 TaxID=1385512 RepID=A0A0A5G319_9BACI|nr:2-amino-4-hydroxy-6-hydroxymethyldihydropteridine diphosphokinase [Pontibacillus litoralis]KGX85503.1 2-amino-4-hydroxy-6-hydroxymethyldihydropteridine pyrophosphokinase [Pontibacillus litoralis JSM 072002]